MENIKSLNAVATSIRSLSIDAIQKANSGHPGMPLGAAEVVAALYGKIMKHNPTNSKWVDRDRFVLSAGHASMLLYSILHLSGYKVSLDDIKSFRQVGSKCPGHPEYGVTDGVECTAGPLGQGVSMAVGMAMAETMMAARFNTKNHKIVDHYTYSLVGEGCLEEGVSSEASSLAGHLKLGKLIVFYDENRVSIDGSTDITFTEDIKKRYEAYNWQVLQGSMYNIEEIIDLTQKAKACSDKPTLIMLKSEIGHFSPKAGTADVHGAALGEDNVKATKKVLGLPENECFTILPEATEYFNAKKTEFAKAEADWNQEFDEWSKENPELREKWDEQVDFFTRCRSVEMTEMPSFTSSDKMATRAAGGKVLNAMAKAFDNLVGGSADLAGPNKTALNDCGGIYSAENRSGRTIEFGIREFAMSAICSGIALHGGFRPFCATFLVFADYLRPQLRLAALMNLPVIYIFTHDSIYVGEDGPTHQPVETLASLRAIPNVQVLRPGDAEETLEAWKMAMASKDHPVCLVLTRQDLQDYEKDDANWKENIKNGAYIVKKGGDDPDITILATGSEVSLAVEAVKERSLSVDETSGGLNIRVVSVIDYNKFDKMSEAEQNAIIGGAKRVICAEAGVSDNWKQFATSKNDLFCIDRFGESGPAVKVAEDLHFTAKDLAKRL